MICSEILLPPHAPPEYQDQATLWNTVEQVEKHPKAQLAYSFDVALQNEFSMEENIELAREFVQKHLVCKGMIADFAVHVPDKEDGGIPNPHFHVMTIMRPIEMDGTWGQKQRREYVLDDEGNRVLDKDEKLLFNAVPTTDWQGLRQCSMHYIRYDVLYTYILSRLQYWSQQAQQDKDRLLKRLLNASDKERSAARRKQASELKKAEKRKAEVDGLFAKMYEDWSAGRITEYNFNMLSEKYQGEQKQLDAKIQQLHEAMEAAAQTAVDAGKWVELMKQYVNPTELTAELLNTLIEKILVHEAVKGEDGSREQEVEIFGTDRKVRRINHLYGRNRDKTFGCPGMDTGISQCRG